MRRRGRVVVNQCCAVTGFRRAVAATRDEDIGGDTPTDVADQRGSDHDQREGQVQRKDRDERRCGDAP